MELLRPCLFFYLLAIVLSQSISSTTNSDPTNANTLQWKGGEGVRRSRVRRNSNLQQVLRLPEKAYAFYMLWRLLNEMNNDTNTIKPLTIRPYKLEFTTSEGPKNMETKVKPTSVPLQEQSTYSIGMTGTNDSTAMASFHTEPTMLDSQKTTQSADEEQSTQLLQTTIQKITEPNQAREQNIPDSTSFKIPSTADEGPSTIAIHEQIDNFTDINGTDISMDMAPFPTDSLLDSQKTTRSGDSQLAEQAVQRSQTTKQKITEPSEATQQHILDSTTFSTKISSKAEESSSVAIREQINHFTGINGTINSTALVSLPTQTSLPDSQKTTQLGDSQLAEQFVQRSHTTKQKIIHPSEVTESNIPASTTFTTKISSKTAEKTSSVAIHEQNDHFTVITGTNNSTTMATFSIDSFPDSEETTPSGDSQLAEQLGQRGRTTKQKMIEPSEVTEHNILDSIIFTTKISSKAEEKTSSIAIHEQIDHFTGVNGTNISMDMASFPTDSLPDSQKTTQSGDPQLVEQAVQHSQTTKQQITEPSEEVTQQHILDSTIFSIKISSKAEESSSVAIHEQNDHFTVINATNNSTTMASFPIDSFPDSQKTTKLRDSQIVEQLVQRSHTTKQKIIDPSEVTEHNILDSITFATKISSKAEEKISSITIHEQIDHFTGVNGTNISTSMASFPIDSFPDLQKTTQSEDSQLDEQSTPEPIIHSTGIIDTNDSTDIISLPTDRPLQKKQKYTQSGAPQLLKYSTHDFQSPEQKITKPSQNIKQPTTFMSNSGQTTTNRSQQETPLQSAIDHHIQTHDILASTMENDNLQPTSFPQTPKNEQPNMTLVINESISKTTPPAMTKQTTLSTDKPEITKNSPHTLSVTWQNGKSNWLVTATDGRVSKHTPPTFTLKQQIQDSTSLLLTEDSPNSDLSEPTSDPQLHKPKLTEEPTNQQGATNAAKSSRDSAMQSFPTINTHRLTNDTLGSSKTPSTSPLPNLTENHLGDSKGPEATSLETGISQQDYTESIGIYQSNVKTQSQHTTNKYTILRKMTSHTNFLLVKDTFTQAPTDGVPSSQTIPVSREKLIMMFTPTPKPPEKHIQTTSAMRNGFLITRTQENPSWISTKQSNIQPTVAEESRSDSINQGLTADSVSKENYTSNDLLTKMNKPTQRKRGRKPSTTTTGLHISKTQTVSRKPKTFISPNQKSANSGIEDYTKSRRDISGLLFTFGCLTLLIIVILLRVIWRRWQARPLGRDMWVAGPPLLWGKYHSVLQNSSSHTEIQTRKENSQMKKHGCNVYETIALKQQLKDLV